MAALTDVEKALLKVVIEVAGDNEHMIRRGIIQALRGINEPGRRTYLWHLLETRAKAKIRAARRNATRTLITA